MRAEDFLENISSDTTLIFHNDGDGVCCAEMVYSYLRSKGIAVRLFCGDLEKRTFDRVDFSEYIVIVDLAIDQYPEYYERFVGKNVLVIDHHPMKRDLNEIGFIHINPRSEKPNHYVSASEVCFDILSKISKPKEWVMRVGGVSDASIKGDEKETEASKMIAAINAVLKSSYLPELVEFLADCNSIDEFITNNHYLKTAEEFQSEVKKVLNEFEEQKHGDPIFFKVDTKYPMKAVIANILFEKYPNNTIFVYREYDGVYKVSARSHRINLNDIVKKASAGIGQGGGHPKAAAASVTDFELFRKRILELV